MEEEQLRREVSGLADEEILALCYAFKSRMERLRLYMDVLRKRGGARAQFASCLICFDLARQGDPTFQREFFYLAGTVRHLAKDQKLVDTLVGGDEYLTFIWDMCRASLDELDATAEPAGSEPETAESAQPVAEINLLEDADFEEFNVSSDEATLWRRFDDAVEKFLGGVVGLPVYDADSGFRLKGQRDTERIETFLRELESLQQVVAPARGFRALVLLFYGTQLRSKGLFGQLNARKQELLRDGIDAFWQGADDVWDVAGVMGPMHADRGAWERMAAVIFDYVQWMFQYPDVALDGTTAYDPVARMLER